METTHSITPATTENETRQQPFARFAPFLRSALLLGAGGGFLFASILTISLALNLSIGAWWAAMAQAHGHVQVYGWAGLFVLGVALYFLPRLRGAPLVMPTLLPWILGAQVVGLLLRISSQPLAAILPGVLWQLLLLASGLLELAALLGVIVLLLLTARRGPPLSSRPSLLGVFPFVLGAFIMLGLAAIVNLYNMVLAMMNAGLIPSNGDDLNVALGLFGFLVPMGLAMSAQSLPMYAGLQSFPRRILWPLAPIYFMGLIFFSISVTFPGLPISLFLQALGMLCMGGVILVFIAVFMRMIRLRGNLPQKVAKLAPSPEAAQRKYRAHNRSLQLAYGPFVAMVATAYLWAALGGILFLLDGLLLLFGQAPLVSLDAIRHTLAVGFITLLICGIAPRMLPGFSGKKIASPALVKATLWLGNIAALLRVCSMIFLPLLSPLAIGPLTLYSLLFGLSGPVGLALVICLAINLWPALAT